MFVIMSTYAKPLLSKGFCDHLAKHLFWRLAPAFAPRDTRSFGGQARQGYHHHPYIFGLLNRR